VSEIRAVAPAAFDSPPPLLALLSEIVSLLSRRVPLFRMPPPSPVLLPFLMVMLLRMSVPAAATSNRRNELAETRLISVLRPPEMVTRPVMIGRPSAAVAGVETLNVQADGRTMVPEPALFAAVMAAASALAEHATVS